MNRLSRAIRTHVFSRPLTLRNNQYRKEVERYVCDAFKSDMSSGDITTSLSVAMGKKVEARIVAKGDGIIAGLAEVGFFLKKCSGCSLRFHAQDGQRVQKGDVIMRVTGFAREILACERTALNCLGRMSGIATLMHTLTAELRSEGRSTLLTPTRKVLWGLLDKRACFIGGGGTHRLNLSDAVLIKFPHRICSTRSLDGLVKRVLEKKGGRFIEVEVSCLKDALKVARTFKTMHTRVGQRHCILLLDNMKPHEIAATLRALTNAHLRSSVLIEASGGITPKNLLTYARSGVDIISMGYITSCAPFLDLSLRITSP